MVTLGLPEGRDRGYRADDEIDPHE
jgi:hypothetical protein